MGVQMKLFSCLLVCMVSAVFATSDASSSASVPARHHDSSASKSAASTPDPAPAPVAKKPASGSPDDTAPPDLPELAETDGWEARFAWGLYHSKVVCLAAEQAVGSWTRDRQGSKAGVPKVMLRAEELLAEACDEAPHEQQRAKMAERALRLYHHAKWLAERNHATAAEWRYREASRIARQTRRNVLASHALGRLGYFLMHWRRIDEAKEVLQESLKVSSKSNPLAHYVLGLLRRQEAGPGSAQLREAEEMIICAGEQPSADLEAERQQVIQAIEYWRKAEMSPSHCMATSDVAHVAVCLVGHVFSHVHEALRG
eukprot:TRINITY_DN5780_c0_g1_i1.p1 TRINITY_DN5780_c0_g1~~TRINITY_DN5780_c0_g1_i1.p1  ORF type:complete len:314 (-),score=66.10 TRINITY_DN5780_c0_g1_i1:35-976(-)